MSHPQIATFARLAKENTPPARVIAGQATKLSRTMHDIRYDAIHDEIVVSNPFANAILTFRGAATGEEPPIRVIQGRSTQLLGGYSLDHVEVDPVHNEILIPNGDSILVFRREANGDVAPIRVIRGPDTKLKSAWSLAVDPVHDLIVVNDAFGGDQTSSFAKASISSGLRVAALLFFNRSGNGNVKPQAVIQGPKTELHSIHQMQIYAPNGWIVVTQITNPSAQEPANPFVGVWSIYDNGDIPPRWKIGGPKSTLKKPRGVTLDFKHKELIVADMRLNSVLTYYFPEIF